MSEISAIQSSECQVGETQNETITLIIPQDIASADGIQVVTLPPGIGDLSNVRVQVADASFDNVDEPSTCHIVHEVVTEPLTDGEGEQRAAGDHVYPVLRMLQKNIAENRSQKGDKVSIAIQANDYDIERRSGRTPARMRVIPAKFRDYKNPDDIKEEPESDEDYEPSDDFEFKPLRGRGRGSRLNSTVGMKREVKKPGKRGRPRKYPKLEPMDIDQLQVPAPPTDVNADSPDVPIDTSAIATVSVDAIPVNPAASASANSEVQHQDQLKIDQAPQESTGKVKGFECKTCSRTFTMKGNLKAHEFIHLGLKPFKCDVANCERVFRTAEACRRHKLTHLGVKLFECDICKTKFSTNQALKEHMSRHTDSRPHACNVCDKRFRQISCLLRHLTTHSDAKPYQCEICNKTFSQMAYLKSHKRSHTGERPFKCNNLGCEKSFAHQSDLIRHKIIHSGKKPYACDLCTARFNDPSSRRRHLKEHTGTKPYSCQLCEESFRRAGQLKVHLSKHHMGLSSIAVDGTRAVVKVPSDTSCLRFLLREDGNIESVPVTEEVINDGQVVTVNTGSNQSCDEQLEHVQSQLQQVLMQLKQQRTQFPQDAAEVDVHVVTLGPDGQIQERVNRIISQTLESMENSSRRSVQEVTEQEMAVQIALDELGVIQDNAIPVSNSEAVMNHNNVQSIVNVTEVDTGPLSPSVLSTAQIMQDIRNAPVQYEHTYTTLVQSSNQNQAGDNFAISQIENAAPGEHGSYVDDTGVKVVQTVPVSSELIVEGTVHIPIEHVVINADNSQKSQMDGFQDSVLQYEIVGEMPEGEGSQVVEIQYTDESGTPNDTPVSQVLEVQYIKEASSSNLETLTQVIEDQYANSQDVQVEYAGQAKLQNTPPTSIMDYVHNPDFGSQEYYNWLSRFVELCKVVPMPLDIDLFQKVSQVHKTLSDVLANPSGVLSIKDNFTTLMSISRDLGGIVNEHLTFVLKNLENSAAQS